MRRRGGDVARVSAAAHEPRCCYGHVAGRLGVALWEQLQRGDRLRDTAAGVELTDAGRAWLATLGLQPTAARAGQRRACGCLDWSERRDHMAGSLARQLFEHFVAEGWVRQRTARGSRGGHRVLDITPSGKRRLLPLLGLD